MEKERSKINFKVLCVIAAAILLSGLTADFIFINNGFLKASVSSLFMKPVLAENIYPMFLCPCCGQPLDKNNICCGMAGEMIDYIDSLAAKNISEKEIILAFAKKYGMNSFANEEKQKEAMAWLIETAPADRPIISFAQQYYDFGDVSQKKGVVNTLFELKNEGNEDLIISRLDSSCGCTSASVVFNGVEGPRFAMAGHGIENPTGWQAVIHPGEIAQLKVYYDPDVHKDFRGPATREVSIFSNDPINFEKKVTIDLNQID